jgi:hypothetical protein
MTRTLAEWQAEIGAWHREAFAWARMADIMAKLDEERREVVLAWAGIGLTSDSTVADELADCLICVLAAMAREGIDADAALAAKFPRVRAKYAKAQPAPAE